MEGRCALLKNSISNFSKSCPCPPKCRGLSNVRQRAIALPAQAVTTDPLKDPLRITRTPPPPCPQNRKLSSCVHGEGLTGGALASLKLTFKASAGTPQKGEEGRCVWEADAIS